MDVLINMASTLTLDACCFDKPVIAVSFGVLQDERTGKDLSYFLYEADHFQDVLNTGAVDLVRSENDLFQSIDAYLTHPERKKEERKKLLEKMCYKVDGQSSKRIADEILSMI
jgi:CDP-glycerol glycerophosphotransferase (TagB/SpsB family)